MDFEVEFREFKESVIKELNRINEKLDSIEKSIHGDSTPIYIKDIKKEKIIMDVATVKDCLDVGGLKGDLQLFKDIYLKNVQKEFYPLKIIGKKFHYWLDNQWHQDSNSYARSCICHNIKMCYLDVNKMQDYQDNIDQFLTNQNYILKLVDEKYQDKVLATIKSYLEKN